MERTTVHLTKQQQEALLQTARRTGLTRAELIRRGIDWVIATHDPNAPDRQQYGGHYVRIKEKP